MAFSQALRKALLKALQPSLQRSRMANLSRVSSLPFMEEELPMFLRHAPSRIESEIDPRAILVGGAMASMPAGALTAHAINALRPYEEEALETDQWLDSAEGRFSDFWRDLQRFRRGDY